MNNMAKEQPDKSLQSVAILIDGSQYTPVHERIKYFNENYPNGAIETMILSQIDSERKIIKALVTPDVLNNPQARFTGHSEAFYDANDDYMRAALEIAETSAVGRALINMGIGIIGGIASADEIVKNRKAKEIIKKKDQEPSKVDYNVIEDEKLREEALAISEYINSATKVEELRDIKNTIRKSGLEKDVLDLVSEDFNNKMRELKKAEKNA